MLFHFICRKPHTLILGLGDCIPVRPIPDSLIESLAEIRMIWKDKSENGLLISLRLYFLPENAPLGRNCHGEVSSSFLGGIFHHLFISIKFVMLLVNYSIKKCESFINGAVNNNQFIYSPKIAAKIVILAQNFQYPYLKIL